MILTLTPTGGSALTLVNDTTVTGYSLLQAGTSWGSPTWEHTFSGNRGTQGARPAQGRLPNRTVNLSLRVIGTSKNDVNTKLSALAVAVDNLRRAGGIGRLKSKNQPYAQRWDVLTATTGEVVWDSRYELLNVAAVGVTLICGPYVLGDPMDVLDAFDTDNVNTGDVNYTADAGALTNVDVSSGVMDAVNNLTTENRFIHTGTGYTYGDHEATVKFAPGSTITSFKAGVVLKRLDISNYLEVYVDDNGTNSRLRIDKVVGAARTNLATTNLAARVVASTYAWVRGRIEGNTVYAEHFLGNVVPNPVVAPSTSTSISLTTGEAATFGVTAQGKAGIVWTPQQTAAYLDDFEVLPFTYRTPPPYTLDCYGAVPGDAPALGTVRLGYPSGVSTDAPWCAFGWVRRSAVENFVRNGDFGSDAISPSTAGWIVTAVSGVTGAASSIATITDATLGVAARYGENCGQVVTPATANTGATYTLYQRFRAGISYTGTIWVRASAGTTTVRLRLGVSGDITSSTAVALSTTWTQHTVTWTPTTAVDVAYLAVEVTAATATTFQIDGAAVYPGATAPDASPGGQLVGAGAPRPLAWLRGEDFFTTNTRTVDANGNGGFVMTHATLAFGTMYVDPGLIDSEDYTQGSVSFAVYARLRIDSAITAVTAIASGGAQWTPATFDFLTPEFGSTGRSVVTPSSGTSKYRMTRLGTLTLPRRATSTRATMAVQATVTAGSGTIGLDDIYLLPTRTHFTFPTGKTTTGYPIFLTGSETLRTINSDLTSTAGSQQGLRVGGGVGGALIEIQPGQMTILGVGSSMVPDDPTASSTSETQAFPSTHVGIVPRWNWARA